MIEQLKHRPNLTASRPVDDTLPVPSPAAEAAFVKHGVSFGARVFRTRRTLRQERLDIEAILDEVEKNLAAVRSWWYSDDVFNRWRHRTATMQTTVWRQRSYQLTSLAGARLVPSDLAGELDSLATDFETAQQRTFFDPQWEPRLVAVALRLCELHGRHPRHTWQRAFLRRPRAGSLPELETQVTIPQTLAELQHFGAAEPNR